jgi:hypothetical protein
VARPQLHGRYGTPLIGLRYRGKVAVCLELSEVIYSLA